VTEVSYFRVTHSVRCSARLQISGWRVSPSLRRSTHSKADVTESCLYCLYPLSCLLGDTKHCLIGTGLVQLEIDVDRRAFIH
ncbi:hypothetical protein PO909_008947, partial [Leuciscus waleckii]